MCLAVPGKIIFTNNDEPLLRMGRVSFGGLIKEVSLAYVPDTSGNRHVIVRAGFALSVISDKTSTNFRFSCNQPSALHSFLKLIIYLKAKEELTSEVHHNYYY